MSGEFGNEVMMHRIVCSARPSKGRYNANELGWVSECKHLFRSRARLTRPEYVRSRVNTRLV